MQFVDNLADQLSTAAGDALYAETLYVMLAVPGAIIALGLAYLAALGTVDRDRRDLALLRARGATRRALFGVAAAESAVIGIAAGLIGAAVALGAVSLLISGGVGLTSTRVLIAVLACVALAIGGALAARIGATSSVWRAAVSDSRRSVPRDHAPLWQRLYLDLFALALSGLIYWLTASTGFSAVVNPDSNPTLSLSIYMFFAPALLWIGATLLLVRLRGRMLAWVASRAAGRRAQTTRGFVLASAGRRGAAINRGLTIVGLLLAFGVNLGIFTATYDQQAGVDSELTLGADVVAAAPPGVTAGHNLQAKIARVPGVTGTAPVEHSYAYVGPDLQDTFGIDTASLQRATTLRDSYFIGAGAHQTLARLTARPDGILVSKETIADYQLHLGDLLNLRVLDHATGRFRTVPFHVAGIVQEFPVGAARLVHGRQPRLPHRRRPRRRPEPRLHQIIESVGDGAAGGGGHAFRRHDRQEHRPAGTTDGQLDHHGRSAWDQQDRRGIHDRARGGRDGPVRGPRGDRAPPGIRHHGRARRQPPLDPRLHLERGRARAARRSTPRHRPRNAARTDAGSHAPARLRSPTGRARDPVGIPPRSRWRRRGDRHPRRGDQLAAAKAASARPASPRAMTAGMLPHAAVLLTHTASITAGLPDFAVRVVGDIGLAGVFVLMLLDGCCIPIPSEATLLFAGFGVSQGRYGLVAVVIAGTLGNLIGSQLAYALGAWGVSGHRAGRGGFHRTAIARSQSWFDRYGRRSVFFGRLVPLVRTFISLPAGMARMPFGQFTLLTVLGCIPWVLGLAALGQAVGSNWKQWKDHLSYVDYAVVAVIVGAAVLWLVIRLRRRLSDSCASP